MKTIAAWIGMGFWTLSGALHASQAPGPSLQGAAAVSQLQQQGQYASVLEAYQQARYGVRGEGQDRWAANPANALELLQG